MPYRTLSRSASQHPDQGLAVPGVGEWSTDPSQGLAFVLSGLQGFIKVTGQSKFAVSTASVSEHLTYILLILLGLNTTKTN